MSISLQFAIFYFLHGNVTRISYFLKVFITILQFYNLLFSTWVYHYNLLFSTFCMGMSLEFPIFWKCLSQFSYFLDVYVPDPATHLVSPLIYFVTGMGGITPGTYYNDILDR